MRQQIIFDPAQKNFEAYLDFSGGRNTEISNERLRENEFPELLNTDLSGRASFRMRTGRRQLFQVSGNAQGMFWYYDTDNGEPDLIFAVSGKLYVHKSTDADNVYTQIPIEDEEGDPFTFQTTRQVEAVLYRGVMFVATGTKLVEVTRSGSTYSGSVVVPYTPSVMEVIYIGTNGLAPNPDTYIQDGVGQLAVLGIKPAKRFAVKNVSMTFTAYIQKPADVTSIDYKWEKKKSNEDTWEVIQDWSASAKSEAHTFDVDGQFDIRVSARETGTTSPVVGYTLTGYEVKPVDDGLQDASTSGIQTCNRVLLHWDRLLLYGDTSIPYQLYISDLENPRYFPVPNTINFDFGKQEDLTDIIRFQDMLVAFTATTIQTLVNKSPADYQRFLINDTVGCMSPNTACVVGNVVLFRSREGIMRLKPNPYRLETMNVDRVDWQIKSEIPSTGEACAMFIDDQYWICFPAEKAIYRYYFQQNAWVKDASDKLDIRLFLTYGKDVYNQSVTGRIMIHDPSITTDAGTIYPAIFETKYLDLSSSFNNKKLKRLYVLGRHFGHTTDVYVTVYADSAIVLTPDSGHAEVINTGEVVWVATSEPNIHFYNGTVFGTWLMGISPWGNQQLSVQRASVRGKCRRVKVRMEVRDGEFAEIYGFGLEFKYKKV